MIVNIIKSYRDVVAICDFELIGKYFEEGRFQLDIKESFFGKDKKTKQEVVEIMQNMKKEDATFNIVGEKSTALAVQTGLIAQKSIKTIQGVPFALLLL